MAFPDGSRISQDSFSSPLTGVTNAVLSGDYSVTGDAVTFTNFGSLTCTVTLICEFQVLSPSVKSVVALYARPALLPPINQNSPRPDDNFDEYKIGEFLITPQSASQRQVISVRLESHEPQTRYLFYVKNKADDAMEVGWSLELMPIHTGPSPSAFVATGSQEVKYDLDAFTEISSLATTAAVANGAFSLSTDIQGLVVVNDTKPYSLTLRGTFTTAPDLGSYIILYGQQRNIIGGSNEPAPSANYRKNVLGRFPIVNIDTVQLLTVQCYWPLTVPGVTKRYFIENNTGQTLPAGWELYETPLSTGPLTS